MFPSQMVILMAIAVGKHDGRELTTRPMDVLGEYVGYLYESLVSRGYLKGNGSTGYQLTSKGGETLVEFLRKNENSARDTLRRLQQLGIDIGQQPERKIDELEKETIKVNLRR